MLKKIWIMSLLSIIMFSNTFAYEIDNLENLYNAKLDRVEKNIETKYDDKAKICYYKNEKYDNLDRVLNLYKSKYPKYKNIFNILITTNNYRYDEIKEQCNNSNKLQVENESDNQENSNIISTEIEKSNNQEDILKSKLWKIIYDYDGTIKSKTDNVSVKLPSLWKIDSIYNNFIVKINDNWIGFEKILTIKVPYYELENGIKYAKENHSNDYIFYKKINNEYKIWLIDKENISVIEPFNPIKWIDYNINKLKETWYIYIEEFFYSKTDKNNIITSWMFKYGDKLYYMSLTWTWEYYEIPKKDIIKHIKHIKKWSIITNWKDKIIVWKKGIKVFYLWEFNIYKDIDLKKLWKILNFTFYTIWRHNLNYSVQDMYNLLNFTKQFEWNSLKDSYKWITSNINYNEKINNILNKEWVSQEILNNKINTDKELIKNWNVFESLKNKEWVCQSISDIFSLIALFNGKNADTVIWMSKRWYLHQVSKIWEYYYDPTYDLDTNERLKYYNISKQQLSDYFDINY